MNKKILFSTCFTGHIGYWSNMAMKIILLFYLEEKNLLFVLHGPQWPQVQVAIGEIGMEIAIFKEFKFLWLIS